MSKRRFQTPWSKIWVNPEELDSERIKSIVNPKDYESVEVSEGKSFYLEKKLNNEERIEYITVLREFLDVFAWTPSDLERIPPRLGEHHIDLLDRSVPV